MNRFLSHPVVTCCSRVLLGFVFIIASIDKIAAPETFAASIQAYQSVPLAVVNLIAIVLPWVELASGILLAAGVSIRANASIVGVLLAGFLVLIGTAMARGLNIDCGCFGAAHETLIGWPKIIEDTGLLLLAIQLIVYPRSILSLEPPEQLPVPDPQQ